MSEPLPPLNALRAYEAAARLGSFARAAEDLHVSASAISRFVKLLEGRLGVALFRRLPNGLEVTADGAAYLEEVSGAFLRLRQATQRLRSGARGLTIGAGPTLAMRWLIPRLAAFHQANPAIDVRISTAIERADPLLPEWTAAIRRGDGAWSGLEAQFLFKAELFPVAAPALARRIKSPDDLSRVRILAAANAPEDWPAWLKAARLNSINLNSAQSFDYPAFALQAALDGLGVAMARAPFVADDLAAGRLVRLFRRSVFHDRGWYLIFRKGVQGDPALAAFRTWLLRRATI